MATLREVYPTNWNRYIKDNLEWKKLELEIEKITQKPRSVPNFYANSKSSKPPYPVHRTKKLKLTDKLMLTSADTVTVEGQHYAQVKVGSTKGLVNLNRIRKPTGNRANVMAAEEAAIRDLNKIFKDIISQEGPINIKLKGSRKIYKNAKMVRNVDEKVRVPNAGAREAKSDFNIIDVKGNDLIFISHKKSGGAKAFQQYGGATPMAGAPGVGNVIEDHSEVQAFLGQVAKRYDESDELSNPMYKVINDKHLTMMSVFGPKYKLGGAQVFGIDNVHVIGQGKPILSPTNTDKLYELSFSDHMVLSGDSKNEFATGDYQAVIGVRKEKRKGFNYGGKRYTNARTGIFPKIYFSNRGGVEKLT
jgi:hypothetical protein